MGKGKKKSITQFGDREFPEEVVLKCFELYLQGKVSYETLGEYFKVTGNAVRYRFRKLAETENGIKAIQAIMGGMDFATERKSDETD